MSRTKNQPRQAAESRSLSIEQLEIGLRALDHHDTDLTVFWDQNIEAFRRTILLAIRETSDALLSPATPSHWRAELEAELEDLLRYFEFAERYRTRRLLSPGPQAPELLPSRHLFH